MCRLIRSNPVSRQPVHVGKLRGGIQRNTWCLGPYAVVDYNLTFSRLQHIYHGQPYARVGLNPMPESTFYPQVRDSIYLASVY
jgi:hypothetical protein